MDSETQTDLFDVIPEITSFQKHVQSLLTSIQSVQDNLNKHMLESAAQFIEIEDVLRNLKTQNSLKANHRRNMRLSSIVCREHQTAT